MLEFHFQSVRRDTPLDFLGDDGLETAAALQGHRVNTPEAPCAGVFVP